MSLGPLELAMLAAIALLFFGPAKLPQLGKSLGDAIRGFKTAMNEIQDPEPPKRNTTVSSEPSKSDIDENSQDDIVQSTAKEKDKTPHS